MSDTFLRRLGARSRSTGTVLCLGLDPDPAGLPPGYSPDLAGVERFATLLLEAAGPLVAAVKPNLAFFEAFGPDGLRLLERLRDRLPEDLPFVVDAKRGDIGSTAARQAVAIIERLRADAVTLSPYLGMDAIRPFLERGAFVYVLCRTSNPSALELQGQMVAADTSAGAPSEPLYLRVARLAAGWAEPARIGLVVGATAPAELAEVRACVPGLPFLVPGLGAQGGDVAAVLAEAPVRGGPAATQAGRGLLVNVSRGIAGAGMGPGGGAVPPDLGERLRTLAGEWAARLPVLS